MRFPKHRTEYLRSLAALVIWIAAASLALATPPGGSITGMVKDQSGAVVAGATIKAINLASGREITATAGEDGRYELKDLAPGIYRLSVVREGFAAAALTVTVEEASELKQDFALAPGAISDTLTVTAGKGSLRAVEDVPQTVSVTTDAEIELRRPLSVNQALERAPNLIQAGGNPSVERPRLRGLASTRVLIVIDGERLNNVRADAGATGVSPSVIDVSQIESAEVLSSSGSSLYGSDALAEPSTW